MKHGANHVELPHFFTPAPTSGKYPQRIFERDDEAIGELLWPPEIARDCPTRTGSSSSSSSRSSRRSSKRRGVLDRSLFHCADEPDGDVQIADYRKARGLLKELAPWMKVIDAMSDPHFATERLSDMPIPSIATAPRVHRRQLPRVGLLLLRPARQVPPAPARHAAGEDPHGRLAVLQARGEGLPALGPQLLVHVLHGARSPTRSTTPPSAPGPACRRATRSSSTPAPTARSTRSAGKCSPRACRTTRSCSPPASQPDDPLLAAMKDYADFPKSEAWLDAALGDVLRRA